MTKVVTLTLEGCTPTPLASYLKALGVLRLISSDANHVSGHAADPHARGWWENDRFHLRTALDREALSAFILNDYAPSPIIAPWNGRAGFMEGDDGPDSSRAGAELMNAIEGSGSLRLASMRQSVGSLRRNTGVAGFDKLRALEKRLNKEQKQLAGEAKSRKEEELGRAKKDVREAKRLLLPNLRATTNEDHLDYIDTCYALAEDDAPSPLLGSGGVDGSRDFGVNFAERLRDVLRLEDGTPEDGADKQLEAALFRVGERMPSSGSIGQFSPGQGGPNATTGFEGFGGLNPWDVVLAMEGTIVFAGAVTRRWGATNGASAAFPFTFQPVGAGAGSLSSADPNRPRGEIWTPLWAKPARYSEIRAVFAEGRLTLGQRSARTGLDAARSVAGLGQTRGIFSFERYSLVQPDAKVPYQATPLGRFSAPDRPRRDLIEDLEFGGWLQSAQRLARGKLAPANAGSTMRQLEDALFQMTESRAAAPTQAALTALGRFAAWMATSPKAREELRPPPTLSSAWARSADDGSPEFRIAAALSGIGAHERRLPSADADLPIALHFAPIEERVGDSRFVWTNESNPPSVVWGTGGLVQNLVSVLERRLIDAAIRGLDDKPLAAATHASLDDVEAFLTPGFDDARCAALLLGLIWTRPLHLPTNSTTVQGTVPFAYAVLKPFFTPDETLRRIRGIAETDRLPIPATLVSRLGAGGSRRDGRATDAAVRVALASARGAGMSSAFDPARSGGRYGVGQGGRVGAGVPSDRLAAALLIPVGPHVLKAVLDRAYPGTLAEENEPMEDIADGT